MSARFSAPGRDGALRAVCLVRLLAKGINHSRRHLSRIHPARPPSRQRRLVPGFLGKSPGSRQIRLAIDRSCQCRHALEHVLEALHAIIRGDVLVGLRALVRINENTPDSQKPRAVNIPEHIISYPDYLARFEFHVVQRFPEEARIGLAVAVMAGNDDRLKIAVESDGPDLGEGEAGLGIGDERQAVAAPGVHSAPV